jgi:nucleoside phosphorylase
MQPDMPTIVAATSLEARAVRRHASQANVIESGVGLVKMNVRPLAGAAISCGLAGGLQSNLPTGTIVIPSAVATNDGVAIECDAQWTARLREAAERLGYAHIDAALLTSNALVVGDARAAWAARGFAAVDMETARIPARNIAAVRVILDTPQRELSPEWLNPSRAMMRPKNWPALFWLAREGPRCADLAARVVAAALNEER